MTIVISGLTLFLLMSDIQVRIKILEARIKMCEAIRAKHLERWTRGIRKWKYQDTEWLNPRQGKETKNEAKAS